MATGQQVIDWIEANTDHTLTDWQQQMIEGIYSKDFQHAVVVKPRRNGWISFVTTVERATKVLESR